MKKKYSLVNLILIISGSFFTNLCTAQVGQWVWMHGSQATSNSGNYGIQGIPDPANDPPSLYEPCEWTDKSGNFWLFGGYNSSYDYADTWKYDPSTNQWTWMNGGGILDDAGSYGTLGVPSASNRPPARGFCIASWTDTSGNFWMFGGRQSSSGFNDLWEYNVSTNLWTWVNGSNLFDQLGVYGTIGVANPANTPGARWETAATWTDNNGDLWLFGGFNFTYNTYNDMWRYHIATNEWTWMKGSQLNDQPSTYGTEGVEASANTPGGRMAYCKWKDNSGYLWMLGGGGWVDEVYRNDLWRFNTVTDNWTWMNGDMTDNPTTVSGTQCVPASSNTPGERFENRLAWTDQNGNLWTYGGTIGSDFTDVWNDLWMYCISKNKWTFVNGNVASNQSPLWGTILVSSPTNQPGGRGGAIGWTDHNGHLYLFGGSPDEGVSTPYNDLWKYTIDPSCGSCASALPPVASFKTNDSILCTFDCINFTDLSTLATSWSWSFPGGSPSSSTDENPQNVCYLASGVFNVTLVASNSGGADTVTISNYINVADSPPTPVLTQEGTTLYCSTDPSYSAYQWYDSTTLIPGATDTTLVITHGGNYNIQVSNSNGCSIAVGINVVLGLESFNVSGSQFTVFPNPVNGELQIRSEALGIERVEIYNMLGERLYSLRPIIAHSKSETVIDVYSLSSGIYFVQIATESGLWIQKFIKE